MRKKGFTIIELLVVISIIALLIGILTPGLNIAKNAALDLKQSSQLKSINDALEARAIENDWEYPDSNVEDGGGGDITTGAHKLAEALIGRDGFGFDDKSTWDATLDEPDATIYATSVGFPDRDELYLDRNKIKAFQAAQIFPATAMAGAIVPIYDGDYDDTATLTGHKTAYILTDILGRRKIPTPDGDNVKVGMPILYYKAHPNYRTVDWTLPDSSVFNYDDNLGIMELGDNIDEKEHPFFTLVTGLPEFYDALIDPYIVGGETPYNRNTFILLCAGRDRLYGTKDDIWNISGK